MKKTDKIPVLTGHSFSGSSQTIAKFGFYRLWGLSRRPLTKEGKREEAGGMLSEIEWPAKVS